MKSGRKRSEERITVRARFAMRSAFTLTEVLIAFFLTCIISIVIYEMFISGTRTMAHAEHKLDYLKESTIVFLTMKRDLHTVRTDPTVTTDHPASIEFDRWYVAPGGSQIQKSSVRYFVENDGDARARCLVREEKPEGGGAPKVKRFCKGTLENFRIEEKLVQPASNPTAKTKGYSFFLRFVSPGDRLKARTEFRRAIFLHNLAQTGNWIPITP